MRHEDWIRFCQEQRRDISTGEKLAADNPRKASKLECHPGNGALGKSQGQEAGTSRVSVRIISVRKRLLDPDNICEKYALDCLRYAQLIPGDEPERLDLQTGQRKAAKGETEHTEIVITYP